MFIRFMQYITETPQPKDVVPPLPGKSPIPSNTVRRFHVTGASPDVIRSQGLRMSAAKGIEGPKAIYGWETFPEAHRYSGGGQRPIVEYYISKKDADYHPVAVQHDIPPRQIVAIHEHWHEIYRYVVREKTPLDMLRGIGSDHDRVIDVLRKQGKR
jgi:hypothetical protein